jgi:hypothetical protein
MSGINTAFGKGLGNSHPRAEANVSCVIKVFLGAGWFFRLLACNLPYGWY